jgi:hypothetical protein
MLTERTQHMIDDGLPGGFLPHLDFESHTTYNAEALTQILNEKQFFEQRRSRHRSARC